MNLGQNTQTALALEKSPHFEAIYGYAIPRQSDLMNRMSSHAWKLVLHSAKTKAPLKKKVHPWHLVGQNMFKKKSTN